MTDLSPPEPPADSEVLEDEDLLTKYNLEILPMETWDNINKISMDTNNSAEPVKVSSIFNYFILYKIYVILNGLLKVGEVVSL